MPAPLRFVAAAIFVIGLSTSASAYEIGLRYYQVTDHGLAEKLHDLDDVYDEREDPLKQQRREAGYNTPEHAEATKQLDALREQRDREFLRLLEGTPPEVNYGASAGAGETVQDSVRANGNPLHVEIRLGKQDGQKIPVEINAEYDGRTLYKGSALLIPLATPYVASKAFIKLQGKRQATLVFVEVQP